MIVLQDHVEGIVPIVISTEGSNPSPSTQSGVANIQLNVQTTTNAAKRKVFVQLSSHDFPNSELLTICNCPTSFQRGRPSKKDRTSAATNSRWRTSFAASQPTSVVPTIAVNSTGNFHLETCVSINTSANNESHNVNSSFSLRF